MEWWTATLAVGALACGAITLRSTTLTFATLAAFMPLALHTLYNDFDRFWVLMLVALVIELAALARCSRAIHTDGGEATAPAADRETVSEMPA